jgi:hypothetical protein
MKRCVEDIVDETTAILPKELWLREIFLHLPKVTRQWYLPLFVVSKMWYSMVCLFDKLVLFGPIKGIRGDTVLAKRFTALKSLTVRDIPLKIMCQYYTSLKEMTLLTNTIWCIKSYHEITKLSNLASLTLGRMVCVEGIDKLVNLEHLSILYITNVNKGKFNIIKLKKIKRLHVGRGFITGFNVDRVRLEVDHIPTSPDAVKLEFLESDSLAVFTTLSYTGRGKLWDTENPRGDKGYYEGDWIDGMRYGNGSYCIGQFKCSGEWKNNNLPNGTLYFNGKVCSDQPVVISCDTSGNIVNYWDIS